MEDMYKEKEKELNFIKSELEESNYKEKSKLEEVMAIIESKSKEIDQKEEFFKKANKNIETQLAAIKEKED